MRKNRAWRTVCVFGIQGSFQDGILLSSEITDVWPLWMVPTRLYQPHVRIWTFTPGLYPGCVFSDDIKLSKSSELEECFWLYLKYEPLNNIANITTVNTVNWGSLHDLWTQDVMTKSSADSRCWTHPLWVTLYYNILFNIIKYYCDRQYKAEWLSS